MAGFIHNKCKHSILNIRTILSKSKVKCIHGGSGRPLDCETYGIVELEWYSEYLHYISPVPRARKLDSIITAIRAVLQIACRDVIISGFVLSPSVLHIDLTTSGFIRELIKNVCTVFPVPESKVSAVNFEWLSNQHDFCSAWDKKMYPALDRNVLNVKPDIENEWRRQSRKR